MKKGIVIAALLLFSAISVAAMTITLGEPSGTKTTNNTNFGCTVTATGEELASLTLWHNLDGTFKANETNSSAVTEGSEYTFTINDIPDGSYEWNCQAANSTNSEFSATNKTFTINTVVNNAPVYTNIPNQTWPQDTITSIKLSDYFTDPDGDAMTYSSTTPSNIGVSINGDNATLTPNNWYGTDTVQFTADDGKGGSNTSNSVMLNVTKVNRAPYKKTDYIANVTLEQGKEKIIDLDDYFGDYDGDTLTYSYRYSSGGTHHVNVTITNTTAEAKLTPEQGWKGIEKVIFTAYDGQGGSLDSNEVTLVVKELEKVNHAPQITSKTPILNPILVVGDSQKFAILKYDEDLDDLITSWYLNNREEVAYKNKDNYTFLALSDGTYTLRVAVTDGEFTESENWTISVQPLAGQQQQQQTQTGQNTTQTEGETERCGNGNVEAGETCETCPKDVTCPPDYKCEQSKCIKIVKQSNWKLVLIVAGAFAVFAAATIIIYKKYKKRDIFGGWQPEYTGEAREIKIEEKKEEKKQDQKPKVEMKKKSVNEVLLKHYIETNIKKGLNINQIKEKLKKVGWSEEKIEETYKAVELDETFKK